MATGLTGISLRTRTDARCIMIGRYPPSTAPSYASAKILSILLAGWFSGCNVECARGRFRSKTLLSFISHGAAWSSMVTQKRPSTELAQILLGSMSQFVRVFRLPDGGEPGRKGKQTIARFIESSFLVEIDVPLSSTGRLFLQSWCHASLDSWRAGC